MIDLAIDNRMFINNELDEAIQELDLIFNTENTELLGDPTFGTNWHQFLWQLNPSPNDMKAYIYEKIANSLYLQKFIVNVEVNVLENNYDGIYQICITISDNNDKKIRVYNIK